MVNKHFFKPLLLDFHNHLTIPRAFFSKYIQGGKEEKKVKLRTDASKITWEVKIEDGLKLIDGWKEFALAHDLRTGDILIFRQEEDKDMSFHVTLFEPSCCEIQYDSCLDAKNNLENVHRIKKVKKHKKKNPIRQEKSSSLDPSLFVSNVLASSLRYDILCLPMRFVRENGLETRCGEIVLMNEKGTSWTLSLKQKPSSGTMYITQGWRRFCRLNGLRAKASFTLKLIKEGKTLVLRLSTTQSKSYSSSSSYFVANISTATLRYDLLHLPRRFVRENRLDRRCGEIVLLNEKGRSWTLNLKRKESCGTMYITHGWRIFCSENGLRGGSSFTFKLIKRGSTLALRLSPTESEDDEIESLSTKLESDKRSFKKRRLTWKASSSPFQNRFVTLNLRRHFFEKGVLVLPIPFTRTNNLNEVTKMTLLDKNGVKWSTKLRSEKEGDRMRLVGGWKDFFKANCVKVGESATLELVWEGDTSCILKFCSKVNQETIDEDVS